MRIALFITCVNELLRPQTGQAVVRVLRRLGHAVEFPMAQTCCGQMQLNSGYPDLVMPLVHDYVSTFEEYDAVVTPSGSCAAMVREHYGRLDARAASVAARTFELSELLLDVLGVEDVGGRFAHRVSYHPTCHGLRMLRLGDRPLRLLRRVRGLELCEIPEATQCCGFGGTFSLKNAAVSGAMLADKCAAAETTGAHYLAAADNSCLAHIGGGLSRRRSGLQTIHYAEILAAGQ
ncbi:Fe-S oxidoreductase [Actinoplanes sp. SE50]|uniref:(Fe-S)-binding protein n=1 Tax=unclassified Actinoplanes TaxID=2626549 RepID=UPI00023EBBB6|nr:MULTISPECIES: (Fe-S)-binding protein [unclassified Actinoplanes]AEV85059.1 hypothetical protein ACPL_4164 [Actinoplanes sp. SE50/110]ATO83450.1 Fe-S oxidoreductase [Actinoplanes sp. SE50]SLM00857.1 Fe-S oxidoreductase [Actinoplanes sp. SE50/110]